LRPLRLVARLRWAATATFVTQFVALDVILGGPPAPRALPSWAFGAAASLALWGLAWRLCAHRAVRVASALCSGTLLAINLWVHRYYGTTVDAQVASSALHSWSDVRPIVVRLFPWALLSSAAAAIVEYVLLVVSGETGKSRPNLTVALAGISIAGLTVLPSGSSPPDMGTLRALSLLLRRPREQSVRAPERRADEVPILPSSRRELPNVLLMVTESVRADTYCSEARPDCPFTPELDRVLPDRIPLRQMRAVASYTAISVAALLTGRTQDRARNELAEAPTLFEYARAVRAGNTHPTIAYWSAQSARIFERDARPAVDSWATLESLVGREVEDEDDVVELGMDQRLASFFTSDLARLPQPFVLVLHFLGTHAPYYVDEAHAPFRPVSHIAGWSSLPSLENAYKDAIIAQDREVAACVKAFLDAEGGSPWLIFFTSDHGEAFGEHGAIHHGQNLYDEQIHVPAWVATGGGALRPEERAELEARRDAFVTHLDVLPTLLDVLGVWRGLGMAASRARMPGHSLLEPKAEDVNVLPPRELEGSIGPAVPITNCTAAFPCPLNTWGVLSGDHALVAQPWDAAWNCVDLASGKEHDMGAPCDRLVRSSAAYFPELPNGKPNRE
jgi:hypothetical protein